jgi:asparagine synthase (glutamine-hydrolysing)
VCGINGILSLEPGGPPVDRDELERTRDAMASRGPDGCGSWISPDGSVGLGHRRLAIIDLSPAAAQPMSFEGDRYQIVYNGEIYNYRELRRELSAQGVAFRSHSDTEVILALVAKEGVEALRRLRGMYALAIWDDLQRTLLLARDPYGIKPLYYSEQRGMLRFASQVRALQAGGGVSGEMDVGGLTGYLVWGSVPEPLTLRRGVRAVPAGHHLLVRDGKVQRPRAHDPFDAVDGSGSPDLGTALEESVREHLVSDVPVAVFLSAGLDSSLIAALAQRRSAEPLTTLTLRFDEFEGTLNDEAPLAAEVARSLGTNHVERRVRRNDFLDVWPRALAAMDQPSIDGFNTYVVSQAAHDEGFKVVLSGLGGDELFGSYPSFSEVPRWRRAARLLGRVPGGASLWPALAACLRPDKPKLPFFVEFGRELPGAYLLRRALFLPGEIRRMLGEELAKEGLAAYDPVRDAGKFLSRGPALDGEWQAVHVMESTQFMRNQLLRDSDWASMAHSLELRVPLVDARLRRAVVAAGFEPALRGGKSALVRQAAPELPDAIWDRPKTGFSIPVMSWIDEQVGLRTHPGAASRKLALKVLEHFGVDLVPPDERRVPVS